LPRALVYIFHTRHRLSAPIPPPPPPPTQPSCPFIRSGRHSFETHDFPYLIRSFLYTHTT
jgi:hypothetical protein